MTAGSSARRRKKPSARGRAAGTAQKPTECTIATDGRVWLYMLKSVITTYARLVSIG